MFMLGPQQAVEEIAREEAAERRRLKRSEGELRRGFTLLVKLPGQGRGFAGKGAKVLKVDTTLDANLHEAVKEAYWKDQNKEPERGFRLKADISKVPAQAAAKPAQNSTKQVTTAACATVKAFVANCGALDGTSLACTMRYDDLPGDGQARRAALLEEANVEELARLEFEAANAKTGKSKKRQRASADERQA